MPKRKPYNHRVADCLSCKKSFDYYLGHTAGKFCSKECYNQSVAIPSKECIICGKLYIPDKGNKIVWKKSKYCSNVCAIEGRRTGKFVKCFKCKKKIWRTPKQMEVTKRQFCTQKCFFASLKGKSNLNNYKKGYRAEKEIMEQLESEGYLVIRNFLSWGVFDILAIGLNHLRFIQSKSSKKEYPLTQYKKDIDRIFLYNVPDFATKEFWVKINRRGWKKYLIKGNNLKKFREKDLEELPKINENELLIVGERPYLNPKRINDFICKVDLNKKKINFIQCYETDAEKKQIKRFKQFSDEYLVEFTNENKKSRKQNRKMDDSSIKSNA